jgi:hypothetical protein
LEASSWEAESVSPVLLLLLARCSFALTLSDTPRRPVIVVAPAPMIGSVGPSLTCVVVPSVVVVFGVAVSVAEFAEPDGSD